MNYNKIIFQLIMIYLISASGIFVIGIFETLKLETFDIVESEIFGDYSYVCTNPQTPIYQCENIDTETYSDAYSTYLEIRNDDIMGNIYLIIVLNGAIFLGLIYWLYSIIKLTKETVRPISIVEILVSYSNLMIILIYILMIVFEYLKDVFVNQLILVLFQDIYSSVYMFQIIDNYFIWLILAGYFVFWVANEFRHLELYNR